MNAALCVCYLLICSEGKKYVVISDYKENQQRRIENVDPCKKCFCSEKILEVNQWESGSETLPFSLQICGFAICGLRHQGNLQICDLRINRNKLADLQFVDEQKDLPAHLWFFPAGKNCRERLYYGRKTADSRCGWLGWLRPRLLISHSPSPGSASLSLTSNCRDQKKGLYF
jgi:hypothetical protein